MFDDFRHFVKKVAKERSVNYAFIANAAGIGECTVKCFMCGANDSRRVAERIADALGIMLVYRGGRYTALVSDERQAVVPGFEDIYERLDELSLKGGN